MPDYGRWSSNGGDPSLNEINRADRFFEALAAKQPVYSTDPEEAELAFLLSGWRDDVRDAPVTAPVTTRDAVEALDGALGARKGPRRSFAVVGSVAAAMLCIGGFGTAVYGAGPGDGLYGMRTAIFGEQEATRDDRVSLASAQLQQVQQLIDNGQWQEAQDKLVAVSTTVKDVGQVEQKQQLVQQWNALTYKVVEQDPAATLPPGEPLPALPSSPLTWLPMPVVDATTTASTTPSDTSASSDATATSPTSPTDSSSPSQAAPPPDGSTTGSSPGSSTTSTSGSTPAAPAGSTTTSPSAAPPPPAVTTTAASPTSSTTTTTTTTTTTATQRQAEQSPSAVPASPPVVRVPSTVADAPAVAPRTAAPAPAAPAPSVLVAPAPLAPVATPVAPPSQTVPATTSAERRTAEPATTTTVVPPS